MNSDKTSYARIELNLGGSLQDLILNNKTIIKDLQNISYSNSYASSILFPFVNRIKNGEYAYNNKNYTLKKNLEQEDNAIHGLVYNKSFECIKEEKLSNYCSVILKYEETERTKGFPYKYSIYLTYTLTNTTLDLHVNVKNNDINAFPFNVGWHPYFISSNLQCSSLKINSNKKLSFNENMILEDSKAISMVDYFQLNDEQFDDCFVLNDNEIYFKTPDYEIQLSSSSKENYLQIYTPNGAKQIALEPMTGFANSFNHNFGFILLMPNMNYNINWKIKLE